MALHGNGIARPGRILLAALALATAPALIAPAQAQARAAPVLIRDAEIEETLRLYAAPVFRAAGLSPGAVKVHIIRDPRINAFVAGGQRIFINTGLLRQARTPGEVIGVLAHEAGHIAGAHLVRMGLEAKRLSTLAILNQVLAAGAVIGGAAAGSDAGLKAGQALMMGGSSMLQRRFLAYARTQEAAADQAAARYLERAGLSGQGMLRMFDRLATRAVATLTHADPYVLTHPMPRQRISNLERMVKGSRHYRRPDPPALVLRHRLMQAKLAGFLSSPQTVWRRYPPSDTSMPARYARAIAAYRRGDLKTALRLIDGLLRERPKYPWFHELKGQALLESGRVRPAITALERAVRLAPRNGLVRLLLAQALLARGDAAAARQALDHLRRAAPQEGGRPLLHHLSARAWGRLGNILRADLATAEAALLTGDRDLAMIKARQVARKARKGSPEWLRANDIVNALRRKRKS